MKKRLIYLVFECDEWKSWSSMRLALATTSQRRLKSFLAGKVERGDFAYSGELPDYHFRNWLDLQIAGADEQDVTKNEYGDEIYSVKADARAKLTEFYRNRAFIFDNSQIPETADNDLLINTIIESAEQYGCRVILVDNLMTAMDVSPNYDPYRAQSAFVKKLKMTAQKYKLAVILIAHPRKEGDDVDLSNDSVAGSSDITNLADTVITYEKITDKEKEKDKSLANYHSRIGVIKNRLTGKRLLTKETKVKVIYSPKTKRIVENLNDGMERICCFGKGRKYEDFVLPF